MEWKEDSVDLPDRSETSLYSSSPVDPSESTRASWLNKIDRKGHTRLEHVAI